MEHNKPSDLKQHIEELEQENAQLKKELKESKEKYRSLYDHAPLPYQSLDVNGHILDVNPAWLDTLGYTREEVIGLYFGSLLHEHWQMRFDQYFPQFKLEGYIHDAQFRIRHQQGHYLDVSFEGCVGYNPDGSFQQTYCVFKDVTARNKMEEALRQSKEELRITLHSIGDAVISTDTEGRVVRMNGVAEQLTGWKVEEAKGKLMDEVFHIINSRSEEKIDNPVHQVLKTGKLVGLANDTRLISKEGRTCQIADSAAPIMDEQGNVHGVVAVFRDVTEQYRMNRQIRESKAFMDAVFQSIQDGISVLATDLTIRYVNPVMEQWYSKKTPLVGKKCYSAYHNAGQPCDPCPSLRAMKSKKTESEVVPGYPDPDSPVRWLELYSYPILDSDSQEVRGVVEFVRDITQREEAERELRRHKDLLTRSQRIARLGSWEMDLKTNTLNWSDEVYRIFGLQPQEFEATFEAFLERVHPDERSNVAQAFRNSVQAGEEGYETEHRIIKKDTGQVRHVHEKADHFRDHHGEIYKSIGMVQDITDQKQYEEKILSYSEELQATTSDLRETNQELEATEEELRASNEELRDINRRLEEQKEEMERAKQKAEESDRLKSTFLANMSHEIRTPMNGIMGFSQMLQERDYPREKQRQFLGIIHSRTRHLLQIINDIVDVSKIEANQIALQFESFYLNDLMDELYNVFRNERSVYGKPYLQIVVDKGLDREQSLVNSDHYRLRQILDNLLSNALKFTDQGWVNFGYALQSNQTLLFYVKDTGSGIPSHQQANIFERFRQAEDSRGRIYEGTGLGLTISKNLAELLGGDMWLESEEGKGSVFYFTLPYKKKNPEKATANPGEINHYQDGQGKTILVIEDDTTSLQYIRELLEPDGYEVIACETGWEGHQRLRENPGIDLILMDIKLPDVNGLELTRKIRSSDFRPDVPIIAQTAYAMSQDARKSMEAGCDDYISKPIDVTSLKEKMQQLLIKGGSQR